MAYQIYFGGIPSYIEKDVKHCVTVTFTDGMVRPLAKKYGCITQKDIRNINNDRNAYKRIQSVTLCDGIDEIGDNAFEGCENLKEITFSNTVKKIGQRAFANCALLNIVEIPETVDQIGARIFENCKNIHTIIFDKNSKLTTIPDSAFSGCEQLQDIKLPNTLTELGTRVFSGCTYLEHITIPSNITVIKAYTFYACKNLKNIQFSSQIHTIEEHAFAYCHNLGQITLPESVREIKSYAFDNAFANCNELQSIVLLSQNITLSYGVFSNCIALKSFNCSRCKTFTMEYVKENAKNFNLGLNSDDQKYFEVVCVCYDGEFILNKVEEPEEWEFDGIRITYSNGITEEYSNTIEDAGGDLWQSIWGSAYAQQFAQMREIELGTSITAIGAYAFSQSNIEMIKAASTCTGIGEGAFDGCSALRTLDFSRLTEPIDVSSWGVYFVSNVNVIIKDGTMNSWNNTVWGSMTNVKLIEKK